MSDEEVKVLITGDASGGVDASNQAKEAVKDSTESMRDSFEGIGSSLEDIQSKFKTAFDVAGITLAYEGLKKIGEVVNELGGRATQISTFSEVLGVTVEQMQAMQEAAIVAGVSEEQFARAGERMVALLTEARNGSGAAIEKLLTLGVTIGQISDPTFKLNDLLEVLHTRLTDSKTAQGEMNQLIVAFGPRAALAAEAIKNYDGSIEGVNRVMRELNGLTEQQIGQAKSVYSAYKEFGEWMGNTFTKIFTGLTSKLGEFGQVLLSTPTVNPALLSKINVPAASSGEDNQQAVAAAQQLQEVTVTAHQVSLGELETIRDSIEAYRQGSAERLAAVQEYYNLAVQYYGSAEVDRVRAIHRELVSEERAYREQLLESANEDARAQQALEKKIEESSIRAFKEIEASAAASAKEQEEVRVGSIDREIEAVQAAAKAHEISARQELEQTQRLLKEKWEAEQAYYAQLRTLYSADQAEKDKVDKQEEAAHQRFLTSMQKSDERYHTEVIQQWHDLASRIESSFTSAITGMLEGTKTFSQAVRSLFASLLDALIGMFVKMAVQWAENMIIQEIAGKQTAASQIAANAGITGAASMASVAAIPYVGWAMAPEVGAANFAIAMGYESALSAAGGYDVPAGVNPMVQIHSREMVLPQYLADTVRAAAAGGGSGGGDTHNVSINAVDAKSFERLISSPANKGAILKVLRSHLSRGGGR